MDYKPSIFNHITESKHDHALLLYNSLKGQSSLICVQDRKLKESLISLFKQKKIDENFIQNVDVWNVLKENGFIVPSSENEILKLRLAILKQQTMPILKLTLMPTEKCNFRCKYCYETHEKGKMDQKLQDAIVSYVRKNIFQFSALQVNWFGGEPLEAFDVMESLTQRLMNICKTAKRRYFSFITTNGYNLDAQMLEKLLKMNIFTYQITLDGLKNTHDQLRVLENGQGTYDRIISNLLDIRDHVKSRHFAILLRTNFSKESYGELEEYVEQYSEWFSEDKRFQFSPKFMGKWNELFDDSFEDSVMNGEDIRKFFHRLNDFSGQLNLANYNFLTSDSLCEASYLHAYVIGSDGTIYKCTADFDFKDNQIGYVKKNGEFYIDEKKHAKWICQGIKDVCEKCFFLGTCQSRSCPKSMLKGDLCCTYEKNFIDDVLDTVDRSLFINFK